MKIDSTQVNKVSIELSDIEVAELNDIAEVVDNITEIKSEKDNEVSMNGLDLVRLIYVHHALSKMLDAFLNDEDETDEDEDEEN